MHNLGIFHNKSVLLKNVLNYLQQLKKLVTQRKHSKILLLSAFLYIIGNPGSMLLFSALNIEQRCNGQCIYIIYVTGPSLHST